ncbi:MAG: gamma-glutamyl-gamma-aminobutyrate hydrolase family protein [Ruminococcaceae bacterium]|nr:gamma-glutamyl-gamma-aminobutyrate hydrolase family protein [Oscillospiraceae bacterium]
MNIATTLRYMDMKKGGLFDYKYFIMQDYKLMADKYGIGMLAVMSEEAIKATVDACDGLILPGTAVGVDPSYYGGAPADPPLPVDEYALDSKVIKAFYEAGKPIFGICGGQQYLNVFFGGTLGMVPDLPNHKDSKSYTHMINIAEDSFVYDVFGKTRALVNSHHARHTNVLAPDFKPVAWTDDGIVEAIEWREADIYATQWHPEQTFHRGEPLDPIEHKFFENFLSRCEARRTK